MASASKRSRTDGNDHEDSDDDDSLSLLMKPTFTKTRSTSRSSTEAKKARTIEANKQLLDSVLKKGEQSLEHQTRLDEARQRNNTIKSPLLMVDEHEQKSPSAVDTKDNTSNGITRTLFRQSSPSKSRSSMDIKASSCLGSRNTLKLERVVKDAKNVTQNPSMACAWSTKDAVRIQFQTLLQWEKEKFRQQMKDESPSSFSVVSLCDHLLEKVSNDPEFAVFMRQNWLADLQETRIRRLPVNMLHWLFATACAPVATTIHSDEPVDTLRIGLDPILLSVKLGAYKTLAGLWVRKLGNPLEQTHVLTLKAMTDQLRDWFGSSFLTENDTSDQNTLDESTEQQSLFVITSSSSSLIQFFHLWELALQNGLVRLFPKKDVNGGQDQILSTICDAIMAILWAALDPVFASSKSGHNDGTVSIQRIVAFLIGAIHANVDEDIYKTWTRDVSLKIFNMWSTQLGGGLKDTDAKYDDRAWLAISRTVQCLGNNHDHFPCRDVQFQLARCAIVHAYGESDKESHGFQKDWLSTSVAESLEEWNVPIDMRQQYFWIVVASASAVTSKLVSSFPGDDPTRCLSLIECSVVCISMAVSDLSRQVDVTRYLQEEASPVMANATKSAFRCALGQLEENADRISSMCRSRIMQNKCFPLTSSVVECLKSYIRLVKSVLAPPNRTPETQQSTIDDFFGVNK